MPRRDVRTHYERTKWQFRQIKRHAEAGPVRGRMRLKVKRIAIITRLRKGDVHKNNLLTNIKLDIYLDNLI